ncbi:MAG: 5-bromo-4-chloroindolyl phosphate hydrolysis family protein [Hyphomonadaceae bacterium]|nr:5-bromo-4-chloroindolyl phosphate hydrolysis family protein [Hyphomonadaceae bacterium]
MTDQLQDRSARALLGAALAAVVFPVLVLALKAPLWLGLVAALGMLGGFTAWGPAIRRAPVDARAAPGRVGGFTETLAEAAAALTRLDRAAQTAVTPGVRAHAAGIAAAARAIRTALEETPGRLGDLHRVFTYYAPRAAAIAEAHTLLSARPDPDEARLAAIEDVLARLDAALGDVARRCGEDALAPLDVELRLMDAALRAELER